MISRSQFVAFVLIFSALGIFFFAHNHYSSLMGKEQSFSIVIARFLATINPADRPAALTMTSEGFAITEESAVLFWFAVSGALLVVALCLVSAHRSRSGPSRFFVPLLFASLVTLASLLKVTFDSGLLNAA